MCSISCSPGSTAGGSSSRRGPRIGTPIVVVSARGTEHDRVHALEIGADDYLVKPFSLKELTARVRAATRRGVSEAGRHPRGDAIVIEELCLDPNNVQAFVDGESAELTPTEFRLAYTLARERGRVLTRDELLQRVWGRRATHREPDGRRLRPQAPREDRPPRAYRRTFIRTRYGVDYSSKPCPSYVTTGPPPIRKCGTKTESRRRPSLLRGDGSCAKSARSIHRSSRPLKFT